MGPDLQCIFTKWPGKVCCSNKTCEGAFLVAREASVTYLSDPVRSQLILATCFDLNNCSSRKAPQMLCNRVAEAAVATCVYANRVVACTFVSDADALASLLQEYACSAQHPCVAGLLDDGRRTAILATSIR